VDRRVDFDGDIIELVGIYAGVDATAVFYRTLSKTKVWLNAVEPVELFGGAGGTVEGGLQAMTFPSVKAGTESITLSSGSPGARDRPLTVTVPVDRDRAARFQRSLEGDIDPVEVDGLVIGLVSACAGVIRAVVELVITPIGEDVVEMVFGDHSPGLWRRGPGPERLWRAWTPNYMQIGDAGNAGVAHDGNGGGVIGDSGGSSGDPVAATGPDQTSSPAGSDPSRLPLEPGWQARDQPGGQPLAVRGWQSSRGQASERPRLDLTLFFDPPSLSATGIEIRLEQVWPFVPVGSIPIRVPSPHAGNSVPLSGNTLWGNGCELELEEWSENADGQPVLVARCDPPDAWFDVGLLTDWSYAALSTAPTDSGRFHGHVLRGYAPLLKGDTVALALRSYAKNVQLPPIIVPLVPPPHS
jgi:hypothetical protein